MSATAGAPLATRPPGRPRAIARVSDGDPRQEILDAAASLFATVGYTATSTRAIAEAVGLRQASLFHYYPRKEAILADLLEGTVRPTLDLVGRLARADLGPEAALWLVVESDVALLLSGPGNPGSLQLLPEARAPQFEWFWRRRARLFQAYGQQIRDGLSVGVFADAAAHRAPDLIFGFVESVITARPSLRSDPTTPVTMADASLRMLGVPPGRLARARRRAATFDRVQAEQGAT